MTYNGLSGKWNIKDDGICRDGCPKLRSMDEENLIDEKKCVICV